VVATAAPARKPAAGEVVVVIHSNPSMEGIPSKDTPSSNTCNNRCNNNRADLAALAAAAGVQVDVE
jgi:hypothetical protein